MILKYMDYQSHFKTNFLSTVLQITKAVWLKISLAYLIAFVITSGMFVLTLGTVFGGLSLPFFQNNNSIFENPIPFDMNIFLSIFQFIVKIILFVLISSFVSSWFYNFSFISTDSKIKNKNSGFWEIFKSSFNSGIFKILLITLLHVIFAFLLIQFGFISMLVYDWLIIIVSLSAVYFIFRSILILPAYLVGKKSLAESFSFSFKHITSLRVLKLCAGSNVLIIILFIIEAVIFGAFFLFSLVSELGFVFRIILAFVQMIILLAVSGFVTSFIISAITGLYYRYDEVSYSEADEEDKQDEDHEFPGGLINNLFA